MWPCQHGRPTACSIRSWKRLCNPFPPLTMLGCIWRCHPGLAGGIPARAGHGRIPSQPGVNEVGGQVHAQAAFAAGACNGAAGLESRLYRNLASTAWAGHVSVQLPPELQSNAGVRWLKVCGHGRGHGWPGWVQRTFVLPAAAAAVGDADIDAGQQLAPALMPANMAVAAAAALTVLTFVNWAAAVEHAARVQARASSVRVLMEHQA